MDSTHAERRRIGLSVRKARLALGLSQERLAEKADLHMSYVSRMELGKVNISWRVLSQCARALRVRPSALLIEAGL